MGKCVNSVDREVREISGTVPAIKSWLIFMERRVLECGQNGYGMLSPFNFLSCLSNEGNRKEKCLYYREDIGCGIVERGGNVLHLKTSYARRPVHLRVDVNRIFSLKLSFTKLHLCSNEQMAFYCTNYMDLRIANKSERYTTDRLPWTIISKYTSAIISVNSRDYGLHIEFEYSIAEKSNHEYTSTYGTYDPHRNYLQMEIVHIAVETIYRIHVEISRCFRCNIIAHDGPHEIFPTILRKRIGPRGFASFSTSAHYSLVFMTKETISDTTAIRYSAELVVYTTYTLNRPTQLVFDNNTRCNGNTNQVRSCVFKIRAPDDSNVKVTLTELRVKGEYEGNDFAAGFVVYNVMGGQPEKVGELLKAYWYFPLHGIPFTSTESTMYVVIFAYSVCASIFAKAATTSERCNGIFVRLNRPTTTTILHFDNSTSIECFRVQTMYFSQWKSVLTELNIRINPDTIVLVDFSKVILYEDRSLCRFNLFDDMQDTLGIKSEKTDYESYYGNITNIAWECPFHSNIVITEIKRASCVLPCRLLFITKGFEHSNLSCNPCYFKYLGGLDSTLISMSEINRKTFIDLYIYSSNCVTVDLLFLIDPTSCSKYITIDIDRNQTFSMDSQLGVSLLYESRCMIRLPRHVPSTKFCLNSKPQTRRVPTSLIRREILYRVMLSNRFLSWSYTARECQKCGGSLLVVHSQMEYQQVEYLMNMFAIGLVYIGWKRKVIHKLSPFGSWSNRIGVCLAILHN